MADALLASPHLRALLVAALILVVYLHQEGGIHASNDGRRYCSGKPQPPPFNRRWCGWPRWLLRASMIVSFLAIGAMTGSPLKAAMLLTLPGFWFSAANDTVDLPCIALAMMSAWCMHQGHTAPAVALSCASGWIHERGPVFSFLYAFAMVNT